MKHISHDLNMKNISHAKKTYLTHEKGILRFKYAKHIIL